MTKMKYKIEIIKSESLPLSLYFVLLFLKNIRTEANVTNSVMNFRVELHFVTRFPIIKVTKERLFGL